MDRNFEKERIMKMQEVTHIYICPNCKNHVFPRYINYSVFEVPFSRLESSPSRSGLYWCPRCLKGKAGMFWRQI